MKWFRGNKLRKSVVGANQKVELSNAKWVTGINLDNAATTPPFVASLKAVNKFAPFYASVHRGKGYKSKLSSNVIEKTRAAVMNFVHANAERDIVLFTKNSTESINQLAHLLDIENSESVILASEMEHLSNDLPWRKSTTFELIKVNEDTSISLEDLELKLKAHNGRVKLVTVTAVSNVTGLINPISKIAKLTHTYGAKIHVDAAQLVSHGTIDMKEHEDTEHIDFLTFTSHKMYSPFGIGVLVGSRVLLSQSTPLITGGGTAKIATADHVVWDELPNRLEAGTQNILGLVALKEAILQFQRLGMNKIVSTEKELRGYTFEKLKEIKDIQLYDSEDNENSSIICFNILGMNHHDVSQILADEFGISTRSGYFCAHQYVHKILQVSETEINGYMEELEGVLPGLIRISFGLYNTKKEIDILIKALKQITQNKEYYNQKYANYPKGACGKRM